MSDLIPKLPELDLKRTLAHVFPGFLLYLGLLMWLDTFVFEEGSPITSLIFRPTSADLTSLVSLIGIGIFVGSILGVMVDGIAHWLFEDILFERVVKRMKLSRSINSLSIEKAEEEIMGYWRKYHRVVDKYPKQAGYNPISNIPNDPEFLYPFTYKDTDGDDKLKLKDRLVSDYYSYFEFYLNSAISLGIVSIILGFFTLNILDISPWQAFVTSALVLGGSCGLLLASIHTLADYKKARILSIEGYLRKRQQEK